MPIKSTNIKMVVSGKYIELYNFAKPYFYNFDPLPSRLHQQSNTKAEKSELSIKRARTNLYRICLANECSKNRNLFLTLTFAKNVTNIKKANYEWKKFLQRFEYMLGYKLKYVCVIEFQKRGAIHYHALFFDIPYIEKIKIKIGKTWRHGFITIKAIKNINNISAYISKYIQKGFVDKKLFNYKCYFTSRNLIRPQHDRNKMSILSFLSNNAKMKLLKSKAYASGRYSQIDYKLYKL